MVWNHIIIFRFNKKSKSNFYLKLLNNYLSSIKDSDEFRAYFEEISQLNIKKLILNIEKAKPFTLEEVIPDILELPNIKTKLEEFEINCYYKIHMNKFIKNWNKYGEYAKLNQVTFTCNKFESKDFFELKKKMEKYFSEF